MGKWIAVSACVLGSVLLRINGIDDGGGLVVLGLLIAVFAD